MTDHRAQALRRITACGGDGEAEAELLALELRAGLELRQGDDGQAGRPVRAAVDRLVRTMGLCVLIPSIGFAGLAKAGGVHEAWVHHMLTWDN